MEPRRWIDLTTEEQNAVLGLCYYDKEVDGSYQWPSVTVSTIIYKYNLDADPSNFTTFLPSIVSDEACEGCGNRMEFLAFSQSDFKGKGLSINWARSTGDSLSLIHI